MDQEYLATGFPDVDGRDDATAYRQCLALLDSLPYFRQYKGRSYELLDLSRGLSVLDLGCGLGDDAFRMAAQVGPDGLVLGVDASGQLIAEAVSRRPAGLQVRFARADARRLPFGDGCLDRCRVDRTLQHIADPRQAIGELARVLKPGGILLAYDNDWGTFSLSGRDEETTKRIAAAWEVAFTNPWIGRYLKLFFLEAGLRQVVLEPSVSVLTDFELADRVYNLRQTLARSVAAGRLDPAAAKDWLADVQAQSRSGSFLCALTAYTVVGTKPEAGAPSRWKTLHRG
jgi:ubiquinone/menaquinone biosynthesis C-methylase UbiE